MPGLVRYHIERQGLRRNDRLGQRGIRRTEKVFQTEARHLCAGNGELSAALPFLAVELKVSIGARNQTGSGRSKTVNIDWNAQLRRIYIN